MAHNPHFHNYPGTRGEDMNMSDPSTWPEWMQLAASSARAFASENMNKSAGPGQVQHMADTINKEREQVLILEKEIQQANEKATFRCKEAAFLKKELGEALDRLDKAEAKNHTLKRTADGWIVTARNYEDSWRLGLEQGRRLMRELDAYRKGKSRLIGKVKDLQTREAALLRELRADKVAGRIAGLKTALKFVVGNEHEKNIIRLAINREIQKLQGQKT